MLLGCDLAAGEIDNYALDRFAGHGFGGLDDRPRAMPGSETALISYVDGANEYQTLRHITLPLLAPSIITAGVFSFILSWNEFLFALILPRQEARTLTIGLLSTNTAEGVRWDWMSATGLIVMIPVFILSMTIRRHFVQGMTMGAVK